MSLDVRNLVVRKGDFELRADFSLKRGKIHVLLGPSGCGKTTLLRSIAGLEPIQEGFIALDGNHIENQPPERRSVGFVFQDLALFEQMSVRQNIGYSLTVHHAEKSAALQKINGLAQRFKIEHLLNHFPSEISGGERQRVALARALARDPSLMLLDEPLSALDAPLRREMRRFMRIRLTAESKLTTIHVTHDVEEALDLADEMLVMYQGRIVGRGTMQEFAACPTSGWLARFMNLGILLPVREILFVNASETVEVTAFSGSKFAIAAENVHSNAISVATARIYIPFSALGFADSARHAPKLAVRIVRNLPIAPGQGKLVVELEGMENYFFELSAENLGPRLLTHTEGELMELSVNERFCRLIPEEPPDLPWNAE